MPLFGPKKSDAVEQPANSIPVDKVIEMKSRSMSNNQIVEALQRDGFSTTAIFDALNQADLRTSASINTAEPLGDPVNPMNFDPNEPEQPAQQQQYPYPNYGQQQNFEPQPMASTGFSENELNEKIEEVTEAIIEEKWKDFAETIEKIIDWKNAMQEKFEGFEHDLGFLKDEFDRLHTALIKKVEQYDRSMNNVGAQLKAMEMVFKDVLPKFTENVNILSEFADTVKKPKEKK